MFQHTPAYIIIHSYVLLDVSNEESGAAAAEVLSESFHSPRTRQMRCKYQILPVFWSEAAVRFNKKKLLFFYIEGYIETEKCSRFGCLV